MQLTANDPFSLDSDWNDLELMFTDRLLFLQTCFAVMRSEVL